MIDLSNSSPIGRLLEEVSWEGARVRGYRDGGRGRENVLTTEAMMLLDFLPRGMFLGGVLDAAVGADEVRGRLAESVEDAVLTVLPEETFLADRTVVQPDASIETEDTYVLVEAKRLRTSAFRPWQLAREWDASFQSAGESRDALLLLIIDAPPPVRVEKNGRLGIADAVNLGRGEAISVELVERHVAWVTWDEVQHIARDRLTGVDDASPLDRTIRRLAEALDRTIEWHR